MLFLLKSPVPTRWLGSKEKYMDKESVQQLRPGAQRNSRDRIAAAVKLALELLLLGNGRYSGKSPRRQQKEKRTASTL